MHGIASASTRSPNDWKLPPEKLKRYPQFDAVISADDATAYVTRPETVAAHKFFPFIEYDEAWTKFAEKGEKGERKVRRLRYGARRDSYIYAYYRHLLSGYYEKQLEEHALQNSVLAYRRIRSSTGGGKCNIHFALDAFEKISQLGNCTVVALDISSFFENLCHDRLKDRWQRLIGVQRLPADHFAVFRNITKYSFVRKQEAYRRLGHFGPVSAGRDGYLTPFRKVPRQLCTGREFREKIGGDGPLPSIIQTNKSSVGIPQGSPISDVLANLYMLPFDIAMRQAIEDAGGFYFRYSDDILIIVPGADKRKTGRWSKLAEDEIQRHSLKLTIKEKKTTVHTFKRAKAGRVKVTHIKGDAGKNGLEYLGFRYDGDRVYLRDSTLSGLYRRVTRKARAEARTFVERNSALDADQLVARYDYDAFVKRFGRVEDFADYAADKRKWTFWTYASRVSRVAGVRGQPVRRQMRRFRKTLQLKMELAIRRAHTNAPRQRKRRAQDVGAQMVAQG